MKKIGTLLLMVILTLQFVNAQYVWRHKACLPAGGRSDLVFSAGNYGYIIGDAGFNGANQGFAAPEVWRYDPTTDTWMQMNNFPAAIIGESVFVINDTAYVGLGFGTTGNYPAKFWKYNAAADQWLPIADFTGTGRYNSMTFTVNGKGYLGCGATYSVDYNDFYEYDPVADSWTAKANFPGTARQVGVGLASGNYGYMGIGTDINDNAVQDFYQYNPATNTWSTMAGFPGQGLQTPSPFTINDTMYVAAGGPSGTNFTADCWRYDVSNNNWVEQESFSCIATARKSKGGFSLFGHGYIFGGYTNTITFNDLLEFGPADNAFATRIQVLGNDTTYSDSFSRILNAGNSCAIWSTGFSGSQITVDTSGTYWVQMNDSCGVTADTIVISMATGIKDIIASEIKLYPNPLNTGNWQLIMPAELVGSIAEIYDDNGRLVFKSVISSQKSEIAIALSSGVYYMRIQTINGVLVKKLVRL